MKAFDNQKTDDNSKVDSKMLPKSVKAHDNFVFGSQMRLSVTKREDGLRRVVIRKPVGVNRGKMCGEDVSERNTIERDGKEREDREDVKMM